MAVNISLIHRIFYKYINISVLLQNIPLRKVIKATSGTQVVYFLQSFTWIYHWCNSNRSNQICPEMHVIRSLRFLISITWCTVALLVNFSITFCPEIKTIKVIKCPPNSNPKLKDTWSTNTNTKVTMSNLVKHLLMFTKIAHAANHEHFWT